MWVSVEHLSSPPVPYCFPVPTVCLAPVSMEGLSAPCLILGMAFPLGKVYAAEDIHTGNVFTAQSYLNLPYPYK